MNKLEGDPTRLFQVISQSSIIQNQEYLPWDKIKYREPPGDLTAEEWWLGITLARTSMRRPLPLYDKENHSFSYVIPDDILRFTEEISRRAGGMIGVPEPVTNPSTRDRYVVNSLIQEAITSSQLEGASTSRQVAKEMLRTGRKPKDRSELMIFNNYNAMVRVGELRNQDLTPDIVCELHRIVTEGTLDDPSAAGRIQDSPDPKDRVAVWGAGFADDEPIHTPPPVEELPDRLQKLCDFANAPDSSSSWVQPVLRSLTIHFMVGFDHYFEDGNGRTARLLFYWSMLRRGYWLTEFITISTILKNAPSQYARSFLYTEQDNGDLTYFFLYHLRVIIRALNELDKYLARKIKELRETRVLLAATPGEYNYRQLALLELAMKNSQAVFTIQSHARSHNVSEETARNDLRDLEKRSLLMRFKSGRHFAWSPAQDLASLIRESQYVDASDMASRLYVQCDATAYFRS
jgi:Fic family protein